LHYPAERQNDIPYSKREHAGQEITGLPLAAGTRVTGICVPVGVDRRETSSQSGTIGSTLPIATRSFPCVLTLLSIHILAFAKDLDYFNGARVAEPGEEFVSCRFEPKVPDVETFHCKVIHIERLVGLAALCLLVLLDTEYSER
jgi:hypothetical protein